MVNPTVLLLIAGGFVVNAQQFEPFNENSISLDGLFDEEFDSISPVSPPSTQAAAETTVPLPPQTTVSPVESINAFNHFVQQANSPEQRGLIFDEVEFPAEEKQEETREESGEADEFEGIIPARERTEEGKRGGISIFRPLHEKSNEKMKKSGSTGWSHKRKRLVRKGTKILRAKWTVVPENISTRRPHFQKKRRVITRVSHVKPAQPPTLHHIPSTKTRSVFRPAPLHRLNKPQWQHSGSREITSRKKKLGISRSRSRESEERGSRRQTHSDQSILSRVARTDERQERGEMKLREEQIHILKSFKNALNKIPKPDSSQIQVNSARQRFEYALDRNAPPSSSLPFHPLSSSSFSHFSPRPLLLPPLRTTQLSSSPRHRLNAHSPPVLLHRLHDGDWQRLRLLQKTDKTRNEGTRRRIR